MLPTEYQQFIHLSRYARWDYELNRRETWDETVERYFSFFKEHLQETCDFTLDNGELVKLQNYVKELKVMPSMRCLMTAGPALKKENVAGYNCSYVKVDHPRSFDEILYVLMNGTGVGFSVEEEYTNKLPTIPEQLYPTDTTIVVADSKLGWARAFKELIGLLYSGHIPKWDVSKVRAAGLPLKTFGGRASGPGPLVDLFKFTIDTFKSSLGRKLKPVECHDIVCKTAEIVVVGGVRRSALISLSDLNDREMRFAKHGEWYKFNVQRSLANNSVNYKEKPDVGTFMREWLSLYDSKSGERGIYSSLSAQKHVESLNTREKDNNGTYIQRRVAREDFGTNPCSEIILRSREFCNLSEVVLRADDTMQSIKDKVRIATILGTFQSTLTDFKYLSREWSRNCDEERLLGVSLTGILDCELTNGAKDGLEKRLNQLRDIAVETNKEWYQKIIQHNIIKEKKDKESILKGIIDGSIDIISTDHAPHTIVEKENLKKPGFPGLETAIPILMDLHDKKIISLKRICETLIVNPINRFYLKRIGKIMPGYKADLAIIDPTREKVIEPSRFFSKAKYSPFDGKKFKGVIMSTFVNGQLVFNDGQIIAKPGIGNIVHQSRESQ